MASPGDSTRSPPYIGRFAPSPTGPLHFGSLLSALASYLDAYANQGTGLGRMEDLDPPREVPGAAEQILQCLLDHGLNWHGDVLYQSQRLEHYHSLIADLKERDLAYPCTCNRARINQLKGIYDGRCREHPQHGQPSATRVKVNHLPDTFNIQARAVFKDLIQGPFQQNLDTEVGDFIICRKDGLVAYQLAVVADDIHQGITHIVRGSDLLDSSPRQQFLFNLLGARPPQFAHIPLAYNQEGQKLSKQNHAAALSSKNASHNVFAALIFLNQSPPNTLKGAPTSDILEWAIANWQLATIPARLHLPDNS